MNKRILVVDRQPDILDLVKEILEDEGYEVLLRQKPFQSITEIETLHPDLTLLAVTSNVNCIGKQTLKKLKHSSIPILALVPEPWCSLKQFRNLMSEHTTFLRSPFHIAALTDAVHQALGE